MSKHGNSAAILLTNGELTQAALLHGRRTGQLNQVVKAA